MNATAVVIGVIATSLFIVGIGMPFSKKQFMRWRAEIELDDIVRTAPSCANESLAKELLVVIGNGYRIAPRLLKVDDSFAELAKLDSWSLWHGQEQVEDWRRARSITVDANEIKTIGDLLAKLG